MEFEELNNEEKLDYLELLCWLSAKINNLDCTLDVPERTEDEILENSSKNTLKCWENLLLSKLDMERPLTDFMQTNIAGEYIDLKNKLKVR